MSIVVSDERDERSPDQSGSIVGGVAVAMVAFVALIVRIRTRRIGLDIDAATMPDSLRRDVGLPPEPVHDWRRFL